MTDAIAVEILDAPDVPCVVYVKGRNAWALRELIDAGATGCTPIERVGPRWSAYVFNLRKAGILVATHYEEHGGDYPGRHARYVLVSRVRLVGCDGGMAVAA
jgi:hypothetical protein